EGAGADCTVQRQGFAAMDEVGDGAREAGWALGVEGEPAGADEEAGILACRNILADRDGVETFDLGGARPGGTGREEIAGADEVGDECGGRVVEGLAGRADLLASGG